MSTINSSRKHDNLGSLVRSTSCDSVVLKRLYVLDGKEHHPGAPGTSILIDTCEQSHM
jgi:hypothetical protein